MADIVQDYTKKVVHAICLDAFCTYTTQRKHAFCQTKGVSICLLNIWMPPVHKQHNESMLCYTKGMSILPHTFGMSPYAWMHPLYV